MPITVTVNVTNVPENHPVSVTAFGNTYSGNSDGSSAVVTIPDVDIGSSTTGSVTASVDVSGNTDSLTVPIYDADGPSSAGVTFTPADGATLTAASQVFTVVGLDPAHEWRMHAGTTLNGTDLFASNYQPGSNTTLNVTGLPTDGSTVHIRVQHRVVSGQPVTTVNQTYTAHTAASSNIQPPAGTTLTSSSQTFTYDEYPGATAYDGFISTDNPPTNIIADVTSGAATGGVYTANFTGIPTDGSILYVTFDSFDFLPGGTRINRETIAITAHTSSTGGGGATIGNPVTYATIIAGSQAQEEVFETDYEHVAMFMRQNQNICYWSNDTGAQTVTALDVPAHTGATVPVTSTLAAAISASSSGDAIDGGGGTFTIGNTTLPGGRRFQNMTIQSSSSSGTFFTLGGSGISFLDVVIDLQDKNYTYGIRSGSGGDDLSFIRSTIRNMSHTGTSTMAAIYMQADNLHCACSRFENIIAGSGGKCRAIWYNAPPSIPLGGAIVNCDFENLQANNSAWDADAIVFQTFPSPNEFASDMLIFGNNGVNMGKRFTKLQSGGAYIHSNIGHWRDVNGPLGYRHKRTMYANQSVNNNHTTNNLAICDYETQNEDTYGFTTGTNRAFPNVPTRTTNIRLKGNTYEMNAPRSNSAGNDHGVAIRDYTSGGGNSGTWMTNSDLSGNRYKGAGSLDYIYWLRDNSDSNGAGITHVAAEISLGVHVATYRT